MFNQPIWGNRFLKFDKKCIFSRTMILANKLFLKDVLDIDGKFKITIYDDLQNKTKYFSDLSIIRKRLQRYKNIYLNNTDTVIHMDLCDATFHSKSKLYYIQLKQQQELRPISYQSWRNEFPDFEFQIFYKNKIKNIYMWQK